jgi:protein-S-isoprenylcysteine O-methyltransferase
MALPDPLALGAAYGLSEVVFVFMRRLRKNPLRAGSRSHGTLWLTMLASGACAFGARALAPFAALPLPEAGHVLGLYLFVTGLGVRWWAILYLGWPLRRQTARGLRPKLVDAGPYRLVRHPSCAGALLACLGLGLCLGNLASLLMLTVPIFWALRRRVRLQERALGHALGEPYRAYCRHTKRLIPFVY